MRDAILRALVVGLIVGTVDGTMTLTTGIVSGWILLANFLLLEAAFLVVGIVLAVFQRRLPRLSLIEPGLLIAALLAFEGRGWKCLSGCDSLDPNRGYVAFATVLAPVLVQLATTRWLRNSARVFFPLLGFACVFAAADFAARDFAPFAAGDTALIAFGMAAFGALVGAASRRSGVAVATLAFVTMGIFTGLPAGYLVPSIPALRIEPSTAPKTAAAANSKPNVLLVVWDTVRAGNMSLYGYSRRTTPNLEALAGESLVFDRAVAPGNYSLPSHASLFTGVLPSEHGAHSKPGERFRFRGLLYPDYALRDDVATLAERLRSAGYDTGGVSANFAYLAPWTGLQRGFRVFDERPRYRVRYHAFIFPLLVRLAKAPREIVEWDGNAVTNAALAYASATSEPFFLFLNYLDAHDPYEQRQGHDFRGDGRGSDLRSVTGYDSEIAFLDETFKTLLDGLRKSGRLDNTLVILVSDHGEFFGEHGLVLHLGGAYEEILHVPLVVRFPRAVPPGRVQRPFGLVEVPRLIEDVVAGRSLDWISEGADEPRVLAQLWGQVTSSDTFDRFYRKVHVEPDANIVFQGSYKLVDRPSGDDQLFDLRADPKETRNLLENPDASIRALHEAMTAAASRVARARPGAEPAAERKSLESLRGLGYIDPTRK